MTASGSHDINCDRTMDGSLENVRSFWSWQNYHNCETLENRLVSWMIYQKHCCYPNRHMAYVSAFHADHRCCKRAYPCCREPFLAHGTLGISSRLIKVFNRSASTHVRGSMDCASMELSFCLGIAHTSLDMGAFAVNRVDNICKPLIAHLMSPLAPAAISASVECGICIPSARKTAAITFTRRGTVTGLKLTVNTSELSNARTRQRAVSPPEVSCFRESLSLQSAFGFTCRELLSVVWVTITTTGIWLSRARRRRISSTCLSCSSFAPIGMSSKIRTLSLLLMAW